MTDYAHNGYAEQKRTEKAVALEAACTDHGLSSDQVRRFDSKDRRWFEKIAGTRPGSDDTWRLVVRLMREAENSPARR